MQQLQQTEEQAPSEGWSSVGSSRQGPDSGTQRLSVHEGAPNPGLPQSPPPPSAQSTSARLLQAGRGYRAASGQRKDEGPGHNHPSLGALWPQQGPEPAGTSGLQGRVAQGGAVGLSRAVGSVQGAPRRSFPSTPEPKQQLPPSLPHAGQSRAGALTPGQADGTEALQGGGAGRSACTLATAHPPADFPAPPAVLVRSGGWAGVTCTASPRHQGSGKPGRLGSDGACPRWQADRGKLGAPDL